MKKYTILLLLFSLVSFAAHKSVVDDRKQRLADELGWVVVPGTCFLCGGYYSEPLLDFEKYALHDKQGTRITAGPGSIVRVGRSTLRGHVVVEQPNKRSESDKAYVYRDKGGRITRIDLMGNVRMREPGRLLLGERARLELIKKSGMVENATYRMARTTDMSEQQGLRRLYGVNAWGTAKKMEQVRDGYYIFYDASYATCPPLNTEWQIETHKLIVDESENLGKAYKTIFRIHGVPVMYLPYYSFALHDERKSGFLFATPGYDKHSGFEFSLPYYWNIAPNYDATITGHYFQKRGFMAEGEFRYLSTRSEGMMQGSFLPSDRVFKQFRADQRLQNNDINALGDNNRAYFQWEHHAQLSPHWSNTIIYNYVSDDYYFQDFSGAVASTLQSQLLREFDLHYSNTHWDFLGRLQDYQTLRPVDGIGVADVYARLPQLYLNGFYPQWKNRADLQWKSEFVYFKWPDSSKSSGSRITLDPSITLPFKTNYGYVTPRLELHSGFYQLQHQLAGMPHDVTRVLPIVSIDSGLYLDRRFTYSDRRYQQTIEPRLFYLYVPFKRQTDIPLFDTGLYTFDYNQLFRTNRFSGDDRIGDANQLSMALTTRIIDSASGQERFRASIGDIVYFSDRRVAYCTDRDGNCGDPQNVVRYTSPTATFSPLVALGEYHFNDRWRVYSDMALEVDTQQTNINNGHLGFRYQANPSHIVDFHYSYERAVLTTEFDVNNTAKTTQTRLHQVGVATAFPLTKRWSLLGALSYNIAFKHLQTSFAGLQYDSCCWAFRFLGVRTLKSLTQQHHADFTNKFYFQLELKGLGSLGSHDTTNILTTNIPGYRDSLFER